MNLLTPLLWAAVSALGSDPVSLPTSLADEYSFREPAIEETAAPEIEATGLAESAAPPPPPSSPQFSLGPAGGYLHAHGADRGTWFAGAQARLHFLQFLAAEASITFHENSYQGGDVHVTQYPVQVSGMIYPLPDAQFSPYVVGGGGWYYSRVTYSGTLSGITNQTEHTFGAHVGAGLEVRLGTSTSLDGDIRYIFLNPSNAQVENGAFNYWQITFGLNFLF